MVGTFRCFRHGLLDGDQVVEVNEKGVPRCLKEATSAAKEYFGRRTCLLPLVQVSEKPLAKLSNSELEECIRIRFGDELMS